MVIFKETNRINCHIETLKKEGKRIGLVPTMGALHDGHLSLLQLSKKENDVTVCSIFINPTQFNNIDDFKHYPVTIEKDIQLLEETGCNFLFLPSASEIYPPDYQKKHYALGKIENILEGFYRPGHFQGVCQVVDRLLEIINPDNLYMGQKDYQQCMVIRKLLGLTGRNYLNLIICPTKRELDGLAMSSRNLRLNEQQRIQAININRVLQSMKNEINQRPIPEIKADAIQKLKGNGFIVDYVEIADAYTLDPADSNAHPVVGLIAASLDSIRLIDNMTLNS